MLEGCRSAPRRVGIARAASGDGHLAQKRERADPKARPLELHPEISSGLLTYHQPSAWTPNVPPAFSSSNTLWVDALCQPASRTSTSLHVAYV